MCVDCGAVNSVKPFDAVRVSTYYFAHSFTYTNGVMNGEPAIMRSHLSIGHLFLLHSVTLYVQRRS